MNSTRGPRKGRRHSLPAIHSPLGLARALPEGSDTFQQALEDLYTQEPSRAPPIAVCEAAMNRLSNIQEGDEDEDEDDENVCNTIEDVRKINRRYSSPVVLNQDEIDALRDRKPKAGSQYQKRLESPSKEYFVKHGHWPSKHVPSHNHAVANQKTTKRSVAFGSHSARITKLKT